MAAKFSGQRWKTQGRVKRVEKGVFASKSSFFILDQILFSSLISSLVLVTIYVVR
jgi:hypothetical protein